MAAAQKLIEGDELGLSSAKTPKNSCFVVCFGEDFIHSIVISFPLQCSTQWLFSIFSTDKSTAFLMWLFMLEYAKATQKHIRRR